MQKFKRLLLFISLFPWSIVCILLYQIKECIITIKPPVEKEIIIIEKKEKRKEEKDKSFMFKSPKDGLKEALCYYNIHHRDIVYAQAVIETAHFTSNVCIKNNNLFGLYDSKHKRYYHFKHWSESVIAYKKWIQNKYKPSLNYYTFLSNINYAEDKNYIKELKKIVQDDKRRYITRDTENKKQ